jgi:hypothetical protein
MSNPGGGSGAPLTNLSGTVRHPEKSRAPFHYPRDAEAPPRSLLPLLPPPVAAATAALQTSRSLSLFSLSRTSSCSTTARFSFPFSHSSLLVFPRFRFYASPTSHKPRTPVYFVYVFLCGRLL